MTKTMSISGGINTYSFNDDRYENGDPPKGRKVYFLNDNGYEIDRETHKLSSLNIPVEDLIL